VPAFRIVEALDVVELGLGLIPRRYILRAVRSVFSEEKKLSIAALSPDALPERLIEQTTP